MTGEGIRFNPAQIRELARILRDTDLSEIEVVEKDSRIRVARQVTVVTTEVAASPTARAAGVPTAGAAPGGAGARGPAVGATPGGLEPEAAQHPGAVTSPMVGVAYLAPEPGAAPFVQVGTRVEQGQTLMLIEAMKTFNQIKAPRAGTVTRILVESGAPVEYGEPLMVIE
jgi:acetyl-CoA carboxylase biotin carboxyl carrier protein